MSDAETASLMAAHQAFYDAMRNGDLEAMDAIWSRTRPVSCTHPGSPAIFGRNAVMESWRVILTVHAPPEIEPLDPHPVILGESALVLCREVVGAVEIMASNAFVLEDGAWLMVNHQASHITDG